ncbi:MAG TPA: tetratricopeptide repeat protein [Thermoanaerobaculia bacterium]|jgi:DNA-binding winged helix-turn-helix (wHTH) protein/tetratricopeptide (TPR) repeat protein|nr:tetratricopeptide repeat protein [Thermoanaerobaculia bacterium]
MNPASNPGLKIRWQLAELVVDPVRRVLLRNGEAVPVTPKAFSILLALLEKPGEVVTKQELIQKIWPDTFVTEANLTQNVSSLRKALGERANDRRFIVTVPGRGYSLALTAVPLPEPGEAGEESQAPSEAPSPPSASPAPASTAGRTSGIRRTVEIEAVPPVPRAVPAPRPRRSRLAPVALGLAVLAAVGVIWLGGRYRNEPVQEPVSAPMPAPETGAPAPAAAQRTTVAVLGFRNLTAEKEADWLAPALAEMLTTEMAAGSRVRVISGENVLRARRSLSLPYADHLERGEMDRLHSFLSADMVVVGAYLSLGRADERRIRLDLRVLKIPEGETVASVSEIGPQAELFDLVAKTGHKLRQALGVADLSEAEEQAVRALRPASPEAARLYTQGISRLRSYDPSAARDLLLEAVRADPSSALIHSALSQTWSVLGYDRPSVDEARKAFELSGSLSREERLAIEAHLQEASKEWGKASETYRSLWSFFPDDLEYGLQLGVSLMMAGRLVEAQATIAALRHLPEPAAQDPRVDLLESRIAYRRADIPAQRRAAAAAIAKGTQSGENLVVAEAMVMEGTALQTIGKSDEAIARLQQAKRLGERSGSQWVTGMAVASLGVALQDRGDLDGAEAAHHEALAIAQKLGTATGMAAQYYTLGTLLQDRGELREAFKLFEQSRVWAVRGGDRLAETRLTRVIAIIQKGEGDLTAALQSAERAIVLSRETGSRLEEALSLQQRGAILDLQDDLEGARRDYLRSFQILRDLGNTLIEASSLAAMADVSARQGDLAGARRRLQNALDAAQRVRDRLGEARILGQLAELAYQSGDLARFRDLSRQQLALAQASGAQSIVASAFQSLGRAQWAAGDLAGAWSSYQAVQREFSRLGEDLRATAVRVDLARVALADGRIAEAVPLARDAAAWYGERGMRSRQAAALAVLAEAYLRNGSAAEAEEMASRAEALVEKSTDRVLRLAISIRVARVRSASGEPDAPLAVLRSVITEADKAGLVTLSLEARLALGEIQVARHDRQGAQTLAAVRAAAAARGFDLLARLAGNPPLQAPQAPETVRPLG